VIPDAKLTAGVKGTGTVIARTDATGIYKVPGFGKHILPQQRDDLMQQGRLQTNANSQAPAADENARHRSRDRMQDAARREITS
jgi:hypothetical protein